MANVDRYSNAQATLKKLVALYNEYNPRLTTALNEYSKTPVEAVSSRAVRADNFNRIKKELDDKVTIVSRDLLKSINYFTPAESEKYANEPVKLKLDELFAANKLTVDTFDNAVKYTNSYLNKTNETTKATPQKPATKPKTIPQNSQAATSNTVVQTQKTGSTVGNVNIDTTKISVTSPAFTTPYDPNQININTATLKLQPEYSSDASATGLQNKVRNAQASAIQKDQADVGNATDWRVRLALSPGATYFYNADDPGILAPLKKTNGVIFPYTPTINLTYAANYDPTQIVHTNYKVFQYTGSSIDTVQLSCDFTAQDDYEANYLLATIHFFRSMTKMFYGQDSDPRNGTPPPLCYIFGLGGYQFDGLPLAMQSFAYNLPADVDYIKTNNQVLPGKSLPPLSPVESTDIYGNKQRLGGAIQPGGKATPPKYTGSKESASVDTAWVPTKITLQVTLVPIMSRNQVSNNFSLKDYAQGKLLQGSQRKGGGFW